MAKIPLLLLLIGISGCVSAASYTSILIGNATIKAEVADSPGEMQRGLMFRSFLGEGQGMLFVFPDEAYRSFWMKNTKIPLDILFISANLTVVDIQAMEPCLADPCPNYPSRAPAKYALEVNKGFAERYGIRAGMLVSL